MTRWIDREFGRVLHYDNTEFYCLPNGKYVMKVEGSKASYRRSSARIEAVARVVLHGDRRQARVPLVETRREAMTRARRHVDTPNWRNGLLR